MRNRRSLLVVGLGLALGGCTREDCVGTVCTFTFELWAKLLLSVSLVLLFALVGLIGVLLAVMWIWKIVPSMKHLAMIAAALVAGTAVVIGPSPWLDRVLVDRDRFEVNVGYWIAPNRHRIAFADVQDLYTEQRVGTLDFLYALIDNDPVGRHSRHEPSNYLVVKTKSGRSIDIPIGDLLRRGALNRIRQNWILSRRVQ